MRQLRNGTTVLHICGITARAKNAADFDRGIGVCRGNQCTCRVIDQGRQLDRHPLDLIVSNLRESPDPPNVLALLRLLQA